MILRADVSESRHIKFRGREITQIKNTTCIRSLTAREFYPCLIRIENPARNGGWLEGSSRFSSEFLNEVLKVVLVLNIVKLERVRWSNGVILTLKFHFYSCKLAGRMFLQPYS